MHADLELRGPERIALTGHNGSGKTTLLRTIAGAIPPESGTAETHVPYRFLPQRLEVLDPALTVVENVARFAPDATNNRIRARLARFLFKGARADQQAGTLSGGERFRASLAALMLAEPAPSCCCSTSRPTTSTSPRSAAWSPPWSPTRAHSSSSATI